MQTKHSNNRIAKYRAMLLLAETALKFVLRLPGRSNPTILFPLPTMKLSTSSD